jgi:hypothetical protein
LSTCGFGELKGEVVERGHHLARETVAVLGVLECEFQDTIITVAAGEFDLGVL